MSRISKSLDLLRLKLGIRTNYDRMSVSDNIEAIAKEFTPGGSELSPATAEKLGGVKIGDGIDVDEDGTISVDGGSEQYLATLTYDYETDEITCDKSLSEMYEHYLNGTLKVIVDSGYVKLNLCDGDITFGEEGNTLVFTCKHLTVSSTDGDSIATLRCMVISGVRSTEDEWHMNYYSVTFD